MGSKTYNSSFIFSVLIISILLTIIAAFFYLFFEMERWTEKGASSEEAKNNVYLAMDRWLEGTGHPLVIYEYGSAEDIKEAKTKNIIIFASSYDWSSSGELKELLLDDKINVVLFIDTDEDNDDLKSFLLDFDIEYRLYFPWEDIPFDDDEDEFSFDEDVYFKIKDADVQTRIQKIGLDKSSSFVCGTPLFMRSTYIQKKNNARLAWSISGALDKDNSGFTIFRSEDATADRAYSFSGGGNAAGLFMENKAALFIIIFTLLLVIAGFSQTIAPFGKWEPQRPLPGKSIKERLLSEARFLKKHHALTLYTKCCIDLKMLPSTK
jgi:hypothetical protein